MDAVECLLTRNTCALLQAPAPSAAQLQTVFQAALRAPDHAQLRPWRFLKITGEALKDFGNLLVLHAEQMQPQLNAGQRQSIYAKALRAPLIIVVIVCLQEHPRVPQVEQYLSTGAAAQNILLAIHALGYQAIWRTGDIAYSALIHQHLGLSIHEAIAGFIYTGSSTAKQKQLPQMNTKDFVSVWSPTHVDAADHST